MDDNEFMQAFHWLMKKELIDAIGVLATMEKQTWADILEAIHDQPQCQRMVYEALDWKQ